MLSKEELIEKAKVEAEAILLPAAKQYAGVLINDIVMQALAEVVADSSNPYDDMLFAALKPVIDAKVKDLLK